MRKTVLILFLFFTSLMFAQEKEFTLSGFIKEKSSGEPMFGVNVLIGNTGITTNEYGFFSLSLPMGSHTVTISYLGFKTLVRTIRLEANIKVELELEEEANKLEEVVVTSEIERNTAGIQTNEMSVVSLRSETIKKLPAILGEPDVLKSIQLLPGVSSVNDAANGFNVRGGSADQNLVLLDESIIYNASHLFGFFSVFNTNAVKDVKLYKGGIPSTYGGRLSSVLDIRQREGNSKAFNGQAGIGLIAGNILLEGPINKKDREQGKGSYMLAARRSWADLFTFLSDEFSDTKLFFYDLNLKVNYELNENNRLYLSGYLGRDNFEIEDFLGTIWGNASGTLRWTSILNEKLFFQTSAIFSNYDYNLDNLRSGSEFRWNSNITNFNLKPRLSWFINARNTIRLGGEGIYYHFRPGNISPLQGSAITRQKFADKFALETAVYADVEQKITPKLSLRYGLRWSSFYRLGKENIRVYKEGRPLTYDPEQDQYNNNAVIDTRAFGSGDVIERFHGLEPRATIRYLFNKSNSIKLGYNRMYQYLHLISNTTSATPLDVWAPSGPFLKPQSLDQIALGYFRSFKKKTYDFNVEVYYKRLNNVTDFIDGADLLFTENIETEVVQGQGRAYGLELQINKNFGKLTGWLSYTLSRAESKVLGINQGAYYPVNNDQRHELNLVGMYDLGGRWELSGNFVFGSGRPITYPSARYEQKGLVVADYNSRNDNRLPAYHRLDIAATLKPKPDARWNGTWIFSIANLYNRQNAASIFFREVGEVNDQEVATGRTEAIKLSYFGIVPSVTFQFNF
ncbi:TonB-dependent receptor [Ascidiimonas aurantiaca]|uniref:TonB-dependent receptor n=1 Tax=Ascidiimonas aurantiaca TaxID=1685432 RepID=UPI0030ED7697